RILSPPSHLRRVGEPTIIPLASSLLTRSSDLPEGIRRAVLPSYLVLLRAGFCLPPVSPRARCALTAPFHPYPPSPFGLRRASTGACPPKRAFAREGGRCVFCATVLRVAPTGRYPAHCPAEFGLSSPPPPFGLRRTSHVACPP